MDSIMLRRLELIINQVGDLTSQALGCMDDCVDYEKAETISKKLESSINRFTSELHNYFRACTEPSEGDISSFSEIQLKADEVLVELNLNLKRINEKKEGGGFRSTGNVALSSKLPKLNLPEFGGDVLEWHQFWDQFESNIGSRNLSEVDKLLYLKSSLKGIAKKAIEGLETTNKSYQIAVTTLKERYGKQMLVIDAHYSALHKIKPARGTTEARDTLNEVEKHLRVLHSYGEDINHNHLRFLIMEKFPEDIIYEMKIKIGEESIEEMRKHLETIISAREEASRITMEGTPAEYTTQTLQVHTFDKKFRPKVNLQIRDSATQRGRRKWEENRPPRYLQIQRRDQIDLRRNPKQNDREMRKDGLDRAREIKTEKRNDTNAQNRFKRRLEERGSRNYSTVTKRVRLNCIFCDGSHYSDKCQRKRTLNERKATLRGRCFLCFQRGHQLRDCKREIYCVYCKAKKDHHRALCPKMCQTARESTNTLQVSGGSTIMQTAVVNLKYEDGTAREQKCRVLLDTGSQRTYIIEKIAKKLKLPIEEQSNLSVFTFGSKTPRVLNSAIVKLHLRTRTNNHIQLYANVVKHISEGVPHRDIELPIKSEETVLADDGSSSPTIDILIGNDYYFTLISEGKIRLGNNLFLIDSKFGWMPSGKLEVKPCDELTAITYFQSIESKLTQPDPPLDEGNMKCLWEIESIGITDPPGAARDEETIQRFNDTIQVINNRYTVSWPWKEYPPNLPTNFGLCLGRLMSILKRMDKITLYHYDKTLKEQIRNGIVEVVHEGEKLIEGRDHPIHYLPHHGVRYPGKPMRIVYDASAKTKNNKSLNECLDCGPLMLEDLTGMLIRFRVHKIGITADVEKAFLQISLQERDKEVTRFLWLKDIEKPATESNLVHLRFCRVPFGIISSPFLLNATLRHHLTKSNQEILKSIINDIYVDNLVTGTDTITEAIELYQTSKRAFQEISMNLREWNSNSNRFMETIPEKDQSKEHGIKVLGLQWNLREDTLQLRLKPFREVSTKREALQAIASIYDPCGYAVPELLTAKIFLQKLWINKYKWDTPLPTELKEEWIEIENNLEKIKDITITRCYFQKPRRGKIQLHCFTDASTEAYAAGVYVVHESTVNFVIGKSRLIPIKEKDSLKIPRLELLGVLIGSRLIKYVKKHIHIQIEQTILWTDSQIVIDWCNSSKLLPPFVARRVKEIKEEDKMSIRYVPTELNPADVATRSKTPIEYKEKWRSGPSFLLDDAKTWPTSRRSLQSLLVEENQMVKQGEEELKKPIDKSTVRNTVENKASFTTSKNLEVNEINVEEVKKLQGSFFPEEVEGKETNLSYNLKLFKDIDGVLRCQGRLKNAKWSFDKRYPILIPKSCDFTENLIKLIHERNYHVGVNHTLSLIRQLYWIPHGRKQVQKVIRKCASCTKHGGGPYKLPPTPALPSERVNYSAPFTFTGMDYLGPVYVSVDSKTEKRWICIYTCLAVRAIHLEIVKDLTAEECLLALRRFMAVRGVPDTITSDNATQFKLTEEVLTNNYCITNKINWKFIPQLAPWHGGFYERLVGLVKHSMKRTINKQMLRDNQLNTIIKEIEAILNTRPLTSVSSELEDVLTPSDFLAIGKCLTTVSVKNNILSKGTNTKLNLIEGWKRGQKMLNDFKTMFTDQYLPSLRERYQQKYKEPRILYPAEPKLGEIVQIKGDDRNREGWKVGKITTLLKGADGQCRVAKVKVGNIEFTRSINHLYPLEIGDTAGEEQNRITTEDCETEIEKENLVTDKRIKEKVGNEKNENRGSSKSKSTVTKGLEERQLAKDLQSNQIHHRQTNLPERSVNSTSRPESGEVTFSNIKKQRHAYMIAKDKIKEWTRELQQTL